MRTKKCRDLLSSLPPGPLFPLIVGPLFLQIHNHKIAKLINASVYWLLQQCTIIVTDY